MLFLLFIIATVQQQSMEQCTFETNLSDKRGGCYCQFNDNTMACYGQYQSPNGTKTDFLANDTHVGATVFVNDRFTNVGCHNNKSGYYSYDNEFATKICQRVLGFCSFGGHAICCKFTGCVSCSGDLYANSCIDLTKIMITTITDENVTTTANRINLQSTSTIITENPGLQTATVSLLTTSFINSNQSDMKLGAIVVGIIVGLLIICGILISVFVVYDAKNRKQRMVMNVAEPPKHILSTATYANSFLLPPPEQYGETSLSKSMS
jgi:hypothetical protein